MHLVLSSPQRDSVLERRCWQLSGQIRALPKQHFLYFFPLPHRHKSLRPSWTPVLRAAGILARFRARPELAKHMVFLTGGAITRQGEAFLRAVPNRYIEKPFNRSSLEQRIRELLADENA
jgi:hypothetical protein